MSIRTPYRSDSRHPEGHVPLTRREESDERRDLPLLDQPSDLEPTLRTPSLSSSERDPLIGARVEGYLIEHKLGRGGFGAVYAGRDLGLDRPVAIKVFTRDDDQNAARRFRDEGRLLARLQHPHIIQVYRVGELEEGRSFLVMERFGDGSILEHWPLGETPDLHECIDIISQLLEALSAAHELGVVHRDIKEANLLYDSRYRHLKLCDFGIARSLEKIQGQAQTTHDGVVIGTAHYIAPERYRGHHHDPRSDLYSAGVLLFRLLTGRRPLERYPKERLMPEEMIYRLFSETIRGLEEIPIEISDICLKLLSVDPGGRYQSASEVLVELERVKLSGALSPRKSVHRPAPATTVETSQTTPTPPPQAPLKPQVKPHTDASHVYSSPPELAQPMRASLFLGASEGLRPPPVELFDSTGDHQELTDPIGLLTAPLDTAPRRPHVSRQVLLVIIGVALMSLYLIVSASEGELNASHSADDERQRSRQRANPLGRVISTDGVKSLSSQGVTALREQTSRDQPQDEPDLSEDDTREVKEAPAHDRGAHATSQPKHAQPRLKAYRPKKSPRRDQRKRSTRSEKRYPRPKGAAASPFVYPTEIR